MTQPRIITALYTLALTLALIPAAEGAKYRWPITQSVEITILSSTSARYTLTMSAIDVDDPAIDQGDTVREVLKSKGLMLPQNPLWGSYHRHNMPSPSGPIARAAEHARLQPNEPFVTEANSLASSQGSGWRTHTHSDSENGGECVGTTLWTISPSNTTPFDTWIHQTWNGGAGTAGDCLGTPPAHEWCALTQPSVSLSHGSIMLQDASGNSVARTAGVQCTSAMKFTLRLQGANSIALSNGMESRVTINGNDVGTAVNGLAGANVVEIGSTLQGVPNRAGAFEGHGVLMVSYP